MVRSDGFLGDQEMDILYLIDLEMGLGHGAQFGNGFR